MPSTSEEQRRYRELKPLGAGGMATVTLAEDTLLGRRVALKRVHVASDLRGVKRLRREALVGASLNHPNVVSVYDVHVEDGGDLVIVMQYVAGHTLRDEIGSRGALPAAEALRILKGVAAGIDAIHARNIVHRDVKPANILLGRDGTVKVADLGVAAAGDRTQITTAGAVVGSFSYMAPEQLDGRTSAPAMDIYALAAVAFEMLGGKKARPEPNPLALAHAISTRPPPDLREHRPQAPAAAAAVLQRGMASDPAHRPRTAGELVGRLQAALDPQSTQPKTPPVAVPAITSALATSTKTPAKTPPAIKVPPRAAPPVIPPHSGRGRARNHGACGVFTRHRIPRARARPAAVLGVLASLLLLGGIVAALGAGGGPSAQHATAPRPAGRRAASPIHRTSGRTSASARAPVAAAAGAGASSSSVDAARGNAVSGVASSGASATPAGVVQGFYHQAAAHNYSAAWQLADANMRSQLAGFPSFQSQMSAVHSVTFHRAQTLGSASASTATVALETTAVLDNKTQRCAGTARTVRNPGGLWLLDGISISCTP